MKEAVYIMNKTAIKALTAICFVPLTVNSVMTLVKGIKIGFAGSQMILALLTALACAVMIIGALTEKPALIGAGAAIYMVLMVISIAQIWAAIADVPDAMKASMQKGVVRSAIEAIAVLAMVLGCFIRRYRLVFCIAAAALHIIRFIMSLANGVAFQYPVLAVLIILGWTIGALLIGIFMGGRWPDSAESDPLLNN